MLVQPGFQCMPQSAPGSVLGINKMAVFPSSKAYLKAPAPSYVKSFDFVRRWMAPAKKAGQTRIESTQLKVRKDPTNDSAKMPNAGAPVTSDEVQKRIATPKSGQFRQLRRRSFTMIQSNHFKSLHRGRSRTNRPGFQGCDSREPMDFASYQ